MNVRRINNAGPGYGSKPVARQRACIVVGGDNVQPESRFSSLFLSFFWTFVCSVTFNLVVGGERAFRPVRRGEIARLAENTLR